MGKYTDEDIRNCKKVTCQIAASYLGITPMAIGFAIKSEDRYHDHIIDEYMPLIRPENHIEVLNQF